MVECLMMLMQFYPAAAALLSQSQDCGDLRVGQKHGILNTDGTLQKRKFVL